MPPDSSPEDLIEPPRCSVCGTVLRGGAAGETQCMRCLLTLAMDAGDEESDPTLIDPSLVRHFGDYELLEEVARGGMGVVYRAVQISLGREVAIKMILAGELAGKSALRMFHTEAQAAAHLHHPNIVPVYEIGEHEMQHYFTMRFVPGRQTVANWAETRQGDFTAIADTTAKVARAVAYAHERGVLHRDLKPSNILWDAYNGPQVTDFGLAKLLNQENGSTRGSASAAMLGSPSYMAPEQTDASLGEVTTVTDVYGIGAVLYELLSGRPPFDGKSALETARRVVEEPLAPLPKVPRDLRMVCYKCLAKRPSDRYASMAALADDLERFARGEPVTAAPLSPARKLWYRALRKPKFYATLVLLLLSVVAGVAGIAWQWQEARKANLEQAKALAHLQWEEIGRWLEEGDAGRGLAYLASLIRQQPDRWQAAMYAMSIVDSHSFSMLAGAPVHPPVKLVTGARLGPDGTWLAGAGEDKVIRVWNSATGQETAQMPQAAVVDALAVADGPVVLAAATQDGKLATCPTLTAPLAALERATQGKAEDLRFSGDGMHLLLRTATEVEVWNLSGKSGKASRVFDLPGGVVGAEISQDGARLLAWNSKTATVWETADGTERFKLPEDPSRNIRRGTLAASGRRMAVIDREYSVRTWEVNTGTASPVIESQMSRFQHLALNYHGGRVTLAGPGNDMIVYDVESGFKVSGTMRHNYVVHRLSGSLDGTRVMSMGWDGTIRTWSAKDGRSLGKAVLAGGGRDQVWTDLSWNGREVLVHLPAERGGAEVVMVLRSSLTSEPERHVVAGQRDSNSGTLSPDGRMGSIGLYPGNRAHVYELATRRVVLDKQTEGNVYVHLFSPDMTNYYALTANGWIYGWDLATGAELWQPHQEPGKVRPGAISRDGSRIIAGHNDGHIRIYDTATGAVVRVLEHQGEVKSLRFAPDGSGRFISTSTDALAHVWDLGTGAKLQTFRGHKHTILASAWSPDSRHVATASYDATVRIWDVATGRPVCPPLQHLAWLSHLEYSPDGRLLATACRDGTTRLWNAKTGAPASSPLQQGQTCEMVRFSADGQTFLVRDHSGFRFWDAETAEPVTVHYSEPVTGGMGMDSECWRAIMNRDGSQVYLAYSMNYGALWKVNQTRGAAPAWFPDLLEALAMMRLDEHGIISLIEPTRLAEVKQMIESSPPDGVHETWARRLLGMPPR